MSLRFPRVLPNWAYRDPAESVAFQTSAPVDGAFADFMQRLVMAHPARDRYYTQARRLHVKQSLKRAKR